MSLCAFPLGRIRDNGKLTMAVSLVTLPYNPPSHCNTVKNDRKTNRRYGEGVCIYLKCNLNYIICKDLSSGPRWSKLG